jgi:hypothetical protein
VAALGCEGGDTSSFDAGPSIDSFHDASVDDGSNDAGEIDAQIGVDASIDVPLPVEHIISGLLPGDSADITIDEPIMGLQLVVESTDHGASGVGIEQLITPGGETWIRDFVLLGTVDAINTANSYLGVAQIPASSAMASPLEAGVYRVQVGARSVPPNATLTLRAREQRVQNGVLDVHIWIPEGLELGRDSHVVSWMNAAGDPDVRVRVDAFYEAVELMGMARGHVTFHSLDASFQTIDSDEELSDAASATSGARIPGAHFVWANRVSLFDSEVWGVTTGIPGIVAEPGTPLSAVALNVSSGISDVGDGWTMAHELGHFAGLFHTTELDESSFDAVTDTAECMGIERGISACGDRRNLMFPVFWGSTRGVGIEVSPEQRRIVAGSLLTRPALASDMEPVVTRSARWSSADRALAPLLGLRAGRMLLASACGHSPEIFVDAEDVSALVRELDLLRAEGLSPFLDRRASALRKRWLRSREP